MLNTTLGMFTSGLALLCLTRSKHTLALGFSIVTALFSLIAFYKFLTGAGIDPNMVRQGAAMHRSHLSHVAISTALGFALTSAAVILALPRFRKNTRYYLADILAMLAACLGVIGILDYTLKPVGGLQDWGNLTGMALPASIGFALSGLGSMLALAKLNPPTDSNLGNLGNLLSVRAFIATATVFILLWQGAIFSDRQNVEQFARERTDTVRNGLKTQTIGEHDALERALSRYTRDHVSEGLWHRDMAAYIRDYRDLETTLLVDRQTNIFWSTGKQLSPGVREHLIAFPRDTTSYSTTISQKNGPTLFIIRAESPTNNTTLFTIRDLEAYHTIPSEIAGPNVTLHVSFPDNPDTADLSENHYAFRYNYPGDQDHEELSIQTIFTENGKAHLDTILPESILVTGFLLAFVAMHGTRLTVRNKQVAKDAEQARLESDDNSKRLDAVMQATPIGMLLVDQQGVIQIFNQAMVRIFGYSEKEFAGMNVDLLLPKANQHSHVAKRAEYAKSPTQRAMSDRDLRGQRKDGSLVSVEVGLNPVPTRHGMFTMATVIDVTERKQFEDELQTVNTSLRNQRDEMEQLVYIVSHDLKSPLVTIQGFSTLLQTEEGDIQDPENQSTLGRIVKASRHMGDLIADILELSRIGRLEDSPETVDLEEMLVDLKAILSTETTTANCEWTLEGPFPKIQASRMRINQIYQNLIGNALRYGCSQKTNRIEIGTTITSDSIQLYVQDHGPGVEADQRERIFNLFQGSKKEGSTGVGLAIVRKVAKFYSGEAWVESQEGQGSKFIVALPKSILAE